MLERMCPQTGYRGAHEGWCGRDCTARLYMSPGVSIPSPPASERHAPPLLWLWPDPLASASFHFRLLLAPDLGQNKIVKNRAVHADNDGVVCLEYERASQSHAVQGRPTHGGDARCYIRRLHNQTLSYLSVPAGSSVVCRAWFTLHVVGIEPSKI